MALYHSKQAHQQSRRGNHSPFAQCWHGRRSLRHNCCSVDGDAEILCECAYRFDCVNGNCCWDYFRYKFNLASTIDPSSFQLSLSSLTADDAIVGTYFNGVRVSDSGATQRFWFSFVRVASARWTAAASGFN